MSHSPHTKNSMAYTLDTSHTGPPHAPLVHIELSHLRLLCFPVPFTCSPLISLKPILHHLAQPSVLSLPRWEFIFPLTC